MASRSHIVLWWCTRLTSRAGAIAGNGLVCGTASERCSMPRHLSQRNRVMPGAFERHRVLAWLGQPHCVRNAFECQRVPRHLRQRHSLMPVWSADQCRRPTSACSPTPLRGGKIGSILARSFGLKAISIYRCGAADAQSVGPRPVTLTANFTFQIRC
jgi:hypothetical protein